MGCVFHRIRRLYSQDCETRRGLFRSAVSSAQDPDCYNPREMFSALFYRLQALALTPNGPRHNILQLLDDWSDDSFQFLRLRVPRIVAVVIIAFILTRLLKVVSRRLSEMSNRTGLPSAVRAQQLRTLSSVTYSVGVFVILFLAAMQILTAARHQHGSAAGQRRHRRSGHRLWRSDPGQGLHQRVPHPGGEPVRRRRYRQNRWRAGRGRGNDPAPHRPAG